MKINVTQPFKFAHHGYQVEEFGLGEVDTTDECAAVALAEGWAEEVKVDLAAEKAKSRAAENKDAAGQRKSKD